MRQFSAIEEKSEKNEGIIKEKLVNYVCEGLELWDSRLLVSNDLKIKSQELKEISQVLKLPGLLNKVG